MSDIRFGREGFVIDVVNVSIYLYALQHSSNHFSLPHNVSTFFVNLYLLSWEALLLHLSFSSYMNIMLAIISDNFFYGKYKGKDFMK